MNNLTQDIIARIADPGPLLTTVRLFIQDKFGTPGLVAASIFLVSLAVVFLMKTIKISFDIIRYVAIPSVAVTFVATYFLPYSFIYILPVTVAFFSVVLIVKG
jgi:hypothetical protein